MSSVKRSNSTASRKSKKKARTAPQEATPLGSFVKDSAAREVDQTELELEEAVFGKSRGGRGVWDLAEEDTLQLDEDEEDQETGLERLRDENLFFVDVPPTASTSAEDTFVSAFPDSADEEDDEDDSPAPAPVVKSKNLRQAAWFDPADEQLTVSLKDVSRLRKLRTTADEDVVSGLDYEGRLRRQFEKMHPAPAWATEARRKVLKKRAKGAASGRAGAEDEDSEDEMSGDEDEVDDLFRGAGTTKKTSRRGLLQPGEIEIDRVRDANQAEATSSGVVFLGFHPRAQVLFSATADRRLRLFQIDGTENPLIQTLHVPELPITTAAYHPSGSSILMTGNRPFFMSYDLQTGQVVRSPRGLLTGGLGGSDRAATGGHGGMEKFRFSQDGQMLAVGGRRGYVHLVDWGAAGVGNGGQVCGEVKMNVAVKGIAWQREGKELLTLGEDSEVYVWDVGTRKCITRWRDDGGFGACGLETDGRDKYTAVASSTGIVNLYDSASTVPDSGEERKAFKAIGNLTTAVTSMRFNHDSQILALASRTNKDQLKLVHLPSATVFSNWPTQQTPLHHVTALDFSRGSEWLAVGNARGKVLLYSVKDFAGRK
ncbi:WD40-repeat-containing domain protein [Leucosporidium creatinivorum]|uniref:WD40-repeat-containing domain protein n=1 Tax=Leucosporidium creatinivorum TaxID=106004 RepID=A0A1Y2EWR5_9BASI|nr:WD40-repeat-containing domain protein [Leucosporidium creatinivorum]